jgi:phenylpyruvate tautomerase PptA (4-oxalocrotonate tautomerase family)
METTEQLSRDQLNQAVSHLIENIQDATSRLLNNPVEDIHIVVNNLLESWLQFTKQALSDPDLISDAQIGYWQDYLSLCEQLHQDLAMLKKTVGTNSKEMILTGFVERFYILISQHVHHVLTNIFNTADKDEGREMESYHRHFSVAIAAGSFKNDPALTRKDFHNIH